MPVIFLVIPVSVKVAVCVVTLAATVVVAVRNNETFFITAEAVFENGARYCHDRAEAIRMAQRQIHMVEEYQLDSHDYDETGTTTGATSRASISDSEVVINADSVLSEFTEIDSYEYGESVISSD